MFGINYKAGRKSKKSVVVYDYLKERTEGNKIKDLNIKNQSRLGT